MPYSSKDLPAHQSQIIYPEPSVEYLDKNVRNWQDKKNNPKQWENIKQFHWYIQNQMPEFCSVCMLSFDSPAWFKLHLTTYSHKLILFQKNYISQPPRNPLYCEHCDFLGANTRRYTVHCKKYEHCVKVAKAEGNPLPTNEKYCETCNQQFASVNGLQVHYRTKTHNNRVLLLKNETCYKCETCDWFASSKQALDVHKTSKRHRINSGEMEKTTTFCTLCQKQWKTSKAYKRHCKGNKHRLRELEQQQNILLPPN